MVSTDIAYDDTAERRFRSGALEGLGSATAVLAIVALALNWFGAHLTFFGAPVVIDDEYVRNYWVLVGVLTLSELVTWVGAVRRRARAAWVWHSVVALTGLVAAVLFAVTTAGPVVDQPEPSPPSYTGPRCYSGGGSHECPGG
jgi:Family of unknown function (DUF6234)